MSYGSFPYSDIQYSSAEIQVTPFVDSLRKTVALASLVPPGVDFDTLRIFNLPLSKLSGSIAVTNESGVRWSNPRAFAVKIPPITQGDSPTIIFRVYQYGIGDNEVITLDPLPLIGRNIKLSVYDHHGDKFCERYGQAIVQDIDSSAGTVSFLPGDLDEPRRNVLAVIEVDTANAIQFSFDVVPTSIF